MALRVHASIQVVIDCFKNINLANQGHYYAVIRVYSETENYKYFAEPMGAVKGYKTIKNKPKKYAVYTLLGWWSGDCDWSVFVC